MASFDNIPGRLTRVHEDVVKPVAPQRTAPWPAELVRRPIRQRVKVAEGIQPTSPGMPNLGRILGGIEISADQRRTITCNIRNPLLQISHLGGVVAAEHT